MSAPAVPEQPVPVLERDQLAKLLKWCAGTTFENRRDTAIIRLFLDTGMRAGEPSGLTLDDIDREQSVAFVMDKGSRGRACPFGAKTADALRRYLRVRQRHPMAAHSQALWIGKKGRMTDSGVRQMLERRCSDAVAFGGPGLAALVLRHADPLGRFGLDQLLHDHPDRLADQINAFTGAERPEQLGHGRMGQGHRWGSLQ